MILGNGKDIDFSRDVWCGIVPLKEKFQELYDICLTKHGNVAYMAESGWRMNFRIWLDERGQVQLRRLRDMLSSCALSEEKDRSKWSWEKSRKFTIKSMHNMLHSDEAHNSNRKIWKDKIPLKIKIFMWLVDQNAILTKDNLAKHNWHGDKKCYFCHTDESVSHIFFECPAKYMWSLVSLVVGADCRPTSFLSSGNGQGGLCLTTRKFTSRDWQLFTGQSGE
jgi:hypothetical protein